MDISQYIDFSQEIDPTVVQDVEARIRTLLKRKWVDLDTNPSSIFGNLFLTPAARVIALMEQTTDCILSDLNLENALNGLVCDCDFLQNYLKGLGVNSLAEVNTTAMVRITFNTNARYKIDQGELLLFNDDYIFSFVHGNNPTITIEPYYYPKVNPNEISYIGGRGDIKKPDYVNNIYHLSASNVTFNNVSVVSSEFFVDLPVYGPASAQVSAGTTATIDENFGYETVDTWKVDDEDEVVGPTPVSNANLANDYITSITMLQDVEPITTPTTIAELIELTLKIRPTAALTTRAGCTSFITNNFPQIVGTSTVLYGDYEMVRATTSDAQNVFPAVDIYNKGTQTLLECTEYCPAKNGGTFTLPLQHMPIKITGISYISDISNSTEETQLELPYFPSDVLAFSGTYNNSTIFSRHKAYRINTSLYDEIQGNTFVKLSYLYDPIQEAIAKTIASDSCGPILNVLSRPFFPIHIRSITVDYKKQAGKFFDRQVAVDEIYNFINNLAYPVVYDDAYIGDIIIGNGATSIDNIAVNCYIQGAEATGLHTDYVQDINTLYINQAAWTSETLLDLQLGTRNVQYVLAREDIHLIEHTV